MKEKHDWSQIVKESAILAPIDRISEVLFGLIMVLSFTGAISVGTDSREDIRELLWAALGCNVAWGLVDAIMYWMNLVVERGHAIRVIRSIQSNPNLSENRESLKNEINPLLSRLIRQEELDYLLGKIKEFPDPSKRLLLTLTDMKAGIQIFFLVFLCTLPIALPFAFVKELELAMRISNAIALVMLFWGGYLLAQFAGFRKFFSGLIYAGIGIILVAITIALGG
ncbi:VIT1/CCC1 transporter family protein [Algoriphagus sp. AK58]|uniref:VIT1/CCC1 transporter family protein n=1 Tax=Algoriphagus sp. AK58 TaxID=1406877 RepID=UPI00164F9A71|nr:VIT1/CCC1 transporter family protein [Algoriphagus sp. AK58]MBC6365432.1 hypothetical protein [Algoriphagus sp. AK58]